MSVVVSLITGAISADIETQRLFIADTNHHRVIIADGDGRIVDCVRVLK